MSLIPVRKNGLWGYITPTGEMAIEPRFERAGVFGKGRAAVAVDDKLGFIDESGSVVIECQYQTAFGGWVRKPFKDDIHAVCLAEKWGFIGLDGKEVIPFTFQQVSPLSDGLIVVEEIAETNSKWGAIDAAGREVIPIEFGELRPSLKEGLVGASRHYDGPRKIGVDLIDDCRWGFVDRTGAEIIAFDFSRVGDFADGLASAANWEAGSASSEAGQFGYIDQDGDVVIPFQFDWAFDFEGELALVKDKSGDEAYGFINRRGHLVIPMVHRLADFNGSDRIIVSDGNMCGLLDYAGVEIVPITFNQILPFVDGLACTSKGGTKEGWSVKGAVYGFIDPDGNEAIPFRFEGAKSFNAGLAAVKVDGRWGLIDREGKQIVPNNYDAILTP